MKSDVYYGTVLKTCRDFVIILVNNFIDRVTVTGNFLFGCCSHTLLHCPVNTDCNINWLSGKQEKTVRTSANAVFIASILFVSDVNGPALKECIFYLITPVRVFSC
ncbi:hypothetical protein ECDEC12B_1602 [Escherichia coli DEC12B]|nr:hypothetical protein ECDEC12B_1602 [Escherichia coli DEC12B]